MKREWHAERVNLSGLAIHLNDLQRAGHIIFAVFGSPDSASPHAVTVVTYTEV